MLMQRHKTEGVNSINNVHELPTLWLGLMTLTSIRLRQRSRHFRRHATPMKQKAALVPGS